MVTLSLWQLCHFGSEFQYARFAPHTISRYLCRSMKITIHLFTVYMFALSLVPCGDGGGGIVEIANHFFGIEHQDASDHEQHSNTCNDDLCSPFCICSCCSSVLDSPVKLPFVVRSLASIPGTKPSFVPNFIHSSFPAFIWQPPQFC
jgi:hypothetical protein